ncbi:MAG: hypothetical protein COA84_15915 [Robiginitomaculum sp.]|nr:MAG: hypothetical protein COA84_15915 [Robiginitomaculum sp.]
MTPQKRKLSMQLAALALAFAVLEWGASYVIKLTDLSYVASLLIFLVPTLPLFGIFPLSFAYAKNNPDAPMSLRRMKPARRYMQRMIVFMFIYVVVLIASIMALNRFDLSIQIKSLLAVLTALPIGGVIWAIARYMADPDMDEFERMILTRSVLLSTSLILFFAAMWGFLENFTDAPDFPLYMMVPVFFGLFGLVQPFVRRGFK